MAKKTPQKGKRGQTKRLKSRKRKVGGVDEPKKEKKNRT